MLVYGKLSIVSHDEKLDAFFTCLQSWIGVSTVPHGRPTAVL